jgi:bile acid-coenzyme A ligase
VPTAWLAVASSGSTGAPKLILHRGALELPLASVIGFLDAVGVAADDRFLPASPLYHSGGIIDSLFGLFAGTTIVLLERFRATVVLQAIEQWGLNSITIVPTMLKRMLEVPDVATRDYSRLRNICSTAAPFPASIRRAWIDILGPHRVLEIYAGSELTGLTSITGTEWLARPGSVGRPVFSEIRIVDESGAELAPGELGEIFMRSTTGGEGFEYRGAQPRRHGDGFYSIGDLGWVDSDGYLFVADRRTDLIVTGGSNVYPNEVEEVLLSHPEIFDVAVIGLFDQEWGKRVHAVVQPVAGASITDDEVRGYARERLVAYKVPKTVEFVRRLPRSELGKVQRNRLIEARERT